MDRCFIVLSAKAGLHKSHVKNVYTYLSEFRINISCEKEKVDVKLGINL